MRKLIYDVGVHDGEDSAYYLHKGFNVVGIEASPPMVEMLKRRFAGEIDDGRYVLLPIAIAAEPGSLEFWVCEDKSEWSSFDRDLAARDGSRHHPVEVEGRTMAQVVAEHGIPFFCKIDIEGSDSLCLDGFTRDGKPKYLSIEMSHQRGGEHLKRLRDLGYDRFKIVDQAHMMQPSLTIEKALALLPKRIRGPFITADRSLRRVRRDGDWVFSYGASGPFGETTPGRWHTYESVLKLFEYIVARSARWGSRGQWFDFHARAPNT